MFSAKVVCPTEPATYTYLHGVWREYSCEQTATSPTIAAELSKFSPRMTVLILRHGPYRKHRVRIRYHCYMFIDPPHYYGAAIEMSSVTWIQDSAEVS
jgi:hypothetical protein